MRWLLAVAAACLASAPACAAARQRARHIRGLGSDSSARPHHGPVLLGGPQGAPPPAPQSGRVFEVDDSSDPKGAWPWLHVTASQISGAGQGVFAKCNLTKETLLGEYRGERFTFGERGASKRLQFDWPYVWRVPRCLAPKGHPVVIQRRDRAAAHNCSTRNGYVYIDAVPLADPETNPLRFVNGAPPADVAKNSWQGHTQAGTTPTPNVEVFFADDRVFYFTSKNITQGEELFVDYGEEYWKELRKDKRDQGDIVDSWSDFASDS